ncbi:Uncharacterised protein [Mycobacterium tuberculosis]|nr:Uncharacterised protein [Mycobacterium tuberculosis]
MPTGLREAVAFFFRYRRLRDVMDAALFQE